MEIQKQKLESTPIDKIFLVPGARMESESAKSVLEIINAIKKILSDENINSEQKYKQVAEYRSSLVAQAEGDEKILAGLTEVFAKTLDGKEKEIQLTDWVWPVVAGDATNRGLTSKKEISDGLGRVMAASELYKNNPNSYFFMTGGQELKFYEKAPEMARLLSEDYGVPKDKVEALVAGKTLNTQGDVEHLLHAMKQSPEKFKNIKEVNIVTDNFHSLRAWGIFANGIYFNQFKKFPEVNDFDKKMIVSHLITQIESVRIGEQPVDFKRTRDFIMDILNPYFANSKFKVVPNVVEEVLKTSSDPSKKLFGQHVEELANAENTLEGEYVGFMARVLGIEFTDFYPGTKRERDLTQYKFGEPKK